MLVIGPHTRNDDPSQILQENPDAEFVRDHLDIYHTITETLHKFGSIAVQDDYKNWDSLHRAQNGGKLMQVDQSDFHTQHIFFDDYAGDYECCVDVRDLMTGQPMSYQQTKDQYLVHCDPHRAILETDYFIRCIEQCEENRDAQIKRIESGIEDTDVTAPIQQNDTEEEKNRAEWDKLQKMTDGDYLMRTVLPVLYQGIRVVDLERPAAPLEYLAMYLLKHQTEIETLPTKPPPPKASVTNTPAAKSAMSMRKDAEHEEDQA